MKKVLYRKEYSSSRGIVTGDKFGSYIELTMYFDFELGLRFRCNVPNFSSCEINPFKAIFRTLEHENVGNMKYQILKDEVRRQDLHRSL